MPKLSELVTDRAELKIPFGETTLTVTYRPLAWTWATRERFMTEGQGLDVFEFLTAAIVEWDLETDDGTTVPLDVEAIKAHTTQVVANKVFYALIAALDDGLGKALGIGSPARSSTARTRRSAKSRTGTP